MSGTKSWGSSRMRVFETLRESGAALSAHTVADRCGLHPNTARFHLDRLVETGQVRRSTSRQSRPGRPTMVYTAGGSSGGQQEEYRFLSQILADSVAGDPAGAPADRARRAGVKAGVAMARSASVAPDASPAEAKTELVSMLEGTGFSPELVPAGGDDRVDLCRCPFAAVVQEHGDVVCSVHLGLMQGMLEMLDAGVHVRQLEPNLKAGRCVAHLCQE